MMSHIANTTFNICTNDEKKALEQITQDINKLKQIGEKNKFSTKFAQTIELIIEEISNAKQKIDEIEGDHTVDLQEAQKIESNYYLQLDNIIKKTENLKLFLNLEDEICLFINTNESNLTKFISDYGYIARVAIESLMSQNIELSDKNIENEIEKVRYQEINAKQSEETIENIKKELNSSSLPVEFKQKLYSEVNFLKNNMDIMDYSALIKSVEIDTMKTMEFVKDVVSQLNKMKFKILSKNFSISKSDDPNIGDEYKISLTAYNQQNNTIAINFGLNGTLDYKLGNYVGHMCDADGEKFIKGLESYGRTLASKKITRTTSSVKPVLKARRINEENK